jgi:uncharacterized membrane protein
VTKATRNFWLAAAAIAALYVFARWWRLAEPCLGFDEIFGAHAASMDWSAMFRFLALDLIHPPLFYALLKIWRSIGGESHTWLRLFPFLWACLAIVPFLLLCRELKLSTRETLAALLLVAVNGALIRYAQEVRMYSLLFCFSIASLWLVVRYVRDGSRFVWSALLAVNLLLVYTHNFGWLVVLAEWTAVAFLKREKLLAFSLACVALAAAFAPWAWVVWRAANESAGLAENIGWIAKPDAAAVTQFILILSEPFYNPASSVDAPNVRAIAVPLTTMLLLCAGIYLVGRARGEQASHLLAIFTLVPIAVALIASWILPYSVWGARHLIGVFAPFAILGAVAVFRLRSAIATTIACVVACVLIATSAVQHFRSRSPTHFWCLWQDLVLQAEEVTTRPTTIFVFEDEAAYHVWWAVRNNPLFRVVSVDGYADMPEDRAYFLPRGFPDVAVTRSVDGEQFWLAFRAASWRPEKQVVQELRAYGYEIGEPFSSTAQGATAYLVPVSRVTERAPAP